MRMRENWELLNENNTNWNYVLDVNKIVEIEEIWYEKSVPAHLYYRNKTGRCRYLMHGCASSCGVIVLHTGVRVDQ